MKLIETSVRWRHGTFVLFALLALFGTLALFQLPVELQPGGDQPEISINTNYAGASPSEVEDLITRPIEDVVEDVQGIQKISSNSRAGSSSITLEFDWNSDIDQRFVDVLSKLQRLSDLPEEAGDPSAEVLSGNSRPMFWAVLSPQPGYTADANHYRDLIQDVVLPRLRQVEGVGNIITPGGREREVEIKVDPKALADRQLSLEDVVNALRDNNRDIRGGPLILGRREYRVRTINKSEELEDFETFILRRDQSGTVYLRDVATVVMGRKIENSVLLTNGQPTAGIGIERRIGSNVSDISTGVRSVLEDLEQELNQRREGVEFLINYDENDYIQQSIELVEGNLILGAILAALVLLLFLGSPRTVAVIALTIPTTVITVFIVLLLLGRSLNVISLAGIAFAVGMVVDNAIVVLENIFSHLQKGTRPMQAAIDGTKEVWSAMLASTLTTVVVFIPIILVSGEAGRLFFDIGIALASAVLFSLFAALTLVPMLAGLFLRPQEAEQMLSDTAAVSGNWLERAVARASFAFRSLERKFSEFLLLSVAWSLGRGRMGRRFLLLAIPLSLLIVSANLLPAMDYLPEGNRNLIMWLTETFPGTSIPEAVRLSEPVREFVEQQPEVERNMLSIRDRNRAIMVFLKPELATGKILNEMTERLRIASNQFPGYRSLFPTRIPIFRNPGKEFTVDVIGADLSELESVAKDLREQISSLNGVLSVRSNFFTGAPELQVIPNRERLAEVGLTESDLGLVVEAALGGLNASEFVEGREQLDVVVELQDAFVSTPEQLRQLAIYTPNGQRVQVSDVAEVIDTTGPDVINRIDLERAISLTVNVAREAPLGALVNRTESEVLEPLRLSLPPTYRLELSGSADLLSQTLWELGLAFLFSLLITYLLLVALYRSFVYPVVIMMTVPMGLAGALLSLVIANAIPGVVAPLDMITGLGFVILTGVVVNNAILLVDRTLQLEQEGRKYDDAIYQAAKDRIRPIFMTAGTSVLGILPLALVPGQGAELYQGLGIVLVGGLTLSTLLTPTVVPALLGLLRDLNPQRS